jgi:hypothetical protein
MSASVGCEEPSRPRRHRANTAVAPAAQVEPSGYRIVEVEEPGALVGVVRWFGELPALDPIPVRVHSELCGTEQPSQALRVSSRQGGVADTVVWLDGVREGLAATPPAQGPSLTVRSCQFGPRVQALGVGWTLRIENDDPVLQNVHASTGDSAAALWDIGLPERGSRAERRLETEGVVHVVSDVHAWMEAWIHVFPHPYFAVTDERGRFRIQGIPPGQYVLRVWHQGWRVVGTRSGRPSYSHPIVLARTVSVSPQQDTMVDFELSEELGDLAGED